jgi:hypothetical protein
VAGAEVVDRHVHADLAELLEAALGACVSSIATVSVISQVKRPGSAGARQHRARAVDQVGLPHLVADS